MVIQGLMEEYHTSLGSSSCCFPSPSHGGVSEPQDQRQQRESPQTWVWVLFYLAQVRTHAARWWG